MSKHSVRKENVKAWKKSRKELDENVKKTWSEEDDKKNKAVSDAEREITPFRRTWL